MMHRMGNMIRLAAAYMRYYKKQTAALFLGIAVSAALLAGIGSLLESGKDAALENARAEYGDWHYATRGDFPWAADFFEEPQGDGYELESFGVETVRKVIEEPYSIQFVYADQGYLDMMGRKLSQGRYPQREDEIAMDAHTLQNLGKEAEIGSEVTLDGETFTLSGILTEMPKELPDLLKTDMQVFVNSTLDYGMNGTFLYLKFKENGHVYQQAEAFTDRFGISGGDLHRNNGIAEYVGSELPVNKLEIIKTGLANKGAGIPYIWGQLNAGGGLTERVILIALGLFGVFIIYSLFQISVSRRIAQYSVMQTVGMTDALAFGVLLSELGLTFLAAYPAGCFVGNWVAGLIYRKSGQIFITQSQVVHTAGSEQGAGGAASLPDAGSFSVSWDVMLFGATFVFCILILICIKLVRRMRRQVIRQMMEQDTEKYAKNRKIYSIKRENMAGVLTKKFMFSRKSILFGILLSMSVGSIIFLSAAYVTENTQRNNELTFKADDGLGSDLQVYEEADSLADVIPAQAAVQMEKVCGVQAVHPVRYLPGEISFLDGSFHWPEYYPELGYSTEEPDQELMEKYNGIAIQTGEDDFAIKVNLYGYDDEMLADLNDYVLEGSVDPEEMRRENSVVFKTIMDGQGNYDAFDVHPQDIISLKTVSSTQVPAEALRFQGEDAWYQEWDLQVAAISSRPLARVDNFFQGSYDMVVDIIMTNEQMAENFGVSDYRTISISLAEDGDAPSVAEDLAGITAGIKHCIVKDYSGQIAVQNRYLSQKMLFFYGIAAVLFAISILHIMNSMQYLVIERRHEFGILRAMGITDAGFCKMLMKEGLRYGIYSVLVITLFFFFVQKILYFFMVHVYRYLQPEAFLSWLPFVAVAVLNLVSCVVVILISGRSVLKQQIIDVIRE